MFEIPAEGKRIFSYAKPSLKGHCGDIFHLPRFSINRTYLVHPKAV
jgi:hypothetical protein